MESKDAWQEVGEGVFCQVPNDWTFRLRYSIPGQADPSTVISLHGAGAVCLQEWLEQEPYWFPYLCEQTRGMALEVMFGMDTVARCTKERPLAWADTLICLREGHIALNRTTASLAEMYKGRERVSLAAIAWVCIKEGLRGITSMMRATVLTRAKMPKATRA